MALDTVAQNGVSIALACRLFGVGARCYGYEPKRRPEIKQISKLLIGLT